MSIALKAIVATALGLLALAPFTRPDQAAHERRIESALASAASESLQEGKLFKWLVVKGASQVQTGRFEQGMLSSKYRVLIAGYEVAQCTGALGVVYCKRS